MSLARPIWVTTVAAIMLATGAAAHAAASARPGSGFVLGRPRPWGATMIRSLDPPAAAAAAHTPPLSELGPSLPQPSAAPRPTPRDELLSNETTFTRWAYVTHKRPVYRHPTTDSARVARLHSYTEDGFPEIYLLLRAHWDRNGQEWIRLRIPIRPNGRAGWVRRQDIGRSHLTHAQIILKRRRLRMYLKESGHRVWSAPVAVGKPSTPTPAGHFWIRERFKIDDSSSGYWPYAFGTSDYSTLTDWPGGGVIGIHGPYYQASAIPGRISHGCIRLRTSDDAWLAHHIGPGTPLQVT